MEIVASIGEHEHDPLRPEVSRKEADQVAGRSVRPVQVFEHDHEGLIRAEPADQREQLLKQVAFVRTPCTCGRLRSGELWDQARDCPARVARGLDEAPDPDLIDQPTERLHDRREHDPVATELHAAAA